MASRISLIFIPLLILLAIGYSYAKKNNAYSSFVKGVLDGLPLFKELFPSIIGMLLCVTLLKSCGIVDDLKNLLMAWIPKSEIIIDLTPMILFRPISGSASIACFDTICKTLGPDSLTAKIAATIQGSTDTTIYILALYFGSVGVTKWKHALKTGLLTDMVGIACGILLALLCLR